MSESENEQFQPRNHVASLAAAMRSGDMLAVNALMLRSSGPSTREHRLATAVGYVRLGRREDIPKLFDGFEPPTEDEQRAIDVRAEQLDREQREADAEREKRHAEYVRNHPKRTVLDAIRESR